MSDQYPPGGQPGPYGNNPQGGPEGGGYGAPGNYGPQQQPPPNYGGQPPQYGAPPPPGYGPPPGSPPNYGYQQSPGATAGSPGTPGYLAGPQGPYGPMPGQPQPQPRKKHTKILVIVGVCVLLLIIVGVGGGVVAFRNAQAVAAAKPPAAVRGYLEALAAGRAEAALTFAATAPDDKSLVTDKVLQQAGSRAPLTSITVPESKEPPEGSTTSIDASFKIGDEMISQRFTLTKVGEDWKLNEAYATVDLTEVQLDNLPMLINGVKTEADSVQLLPGSYKLTTGIDAIGYGDDEFIVKNLTDEPDMPSTTATLTKSGNNTFMSVAKASLKSCLARKETNPEGCPNQIFPSSDQAVTESSIRWSAHDDTWGDFKGGLVDSGSGSYVAKGKLGLKFLFTASGTASGLPTTFDNDSWSNQWRYFYISADLTKEPVKVVWETTT